MIRSILIILAAIALSGCSPKADPPIADGIESQASDPRTGASITTRINQDEIGTADRVEVEVRLEWSSPTTLSLVEPDWVHSGWTLIDTHQEPTQTTETGFRSSSTYLIEPFLPGEYVLPLFLARITPDSESEPYELASLPLTVRVNSVLDEEDPGDLAPAASMLDPSTEPVTESRSSIMAITIGVVFLAFLLIIIWRFARSTRRSQEDESVIAQLMRVAKGSDQSVTDAYGTLYRAITRLDPRLQQTSEIHAFIEQCERARFSYTSSDTLDPQAMAQHTLELLGVFDGEGA